MRAFVQDDRDAHRGPAVSSGVPDRLAAAVVDRRFQLGWVATEPGASDVDRTRGGAGNVSQRSDESEVGQHLRLEPMSHVPQLANRVIEALADLEEQPVKTSIAVGQLAGEAEPDAHRHQALLDPVVEIAFQQLPLHINRLRDACE
jgi:hypothetical protein